MKTKLTLSIDEELIQFAHQEARRESTSISDMMTNYLRSRRERHEHRALPTASSMVGSLKKYDIDDSKEGIREAYANKYLH